jgi:hypothetical protein
MRQKAKTLLCFFWSIACSFIAFTQEFVDVIDETITVNSATALTGYTRNITHVTLPPKTTGYIYRITVSPKGAMPVGEGLLALLEKVGSANISFGVSLARFAIKNNDNSAVDAFIFSNTFDADDFYSKKDETWGSCKSMPNRVNCCFSTNECMGQDIYFGFKNNNISQGLDVKLEVVAVVDQSQETEYKYPYSILNATGQEARYFLSLDKSEWEETSLRNGYKRMFSIDQPAIYFKIITDNSKVALYKITSSERYKIIWSDENGRWDILRY